MKAQVEERPNNAISIVRGPLVYGLKIGEEWKRVHKDQPHRELPHADWEVYATTPWNYGLAVNADIKFEERDVGEQPFSPEGAPVVALVKGQRVSNWRLLNGSADELPKHPKGSGEEETLTLVPYGCTNLRIAEFPTLP